jgi:hypothetical protein
MPCSPLAWQLKVTQKLSPAKIEFRLRRFAVIGQRPILANGVRPLEDPILPRRQSAVDLGVDRFRSAKP